MKNAKGRPAFQDLYSCEDRKTRGTQEEGWCQANCTCDLSIRKRESNGARDLLGQHGKSPLPTTQKDTS